MELDPLRQSMKMNIFQLVFNSCTCVTIGYQSINSISLMIENQQHQLDSLNNNNNNNNVSRSTNNNTNNTNTNINHGYHFDESHRHPVKRKRHETNSSK